MNYVRGPEGIAKYNSIKKTFPPTTHALYMPRDPEHNLF